MTYNQRKVAARWLVTVRGEDPDEQTMRLDGDVSYFAPRWEWVAHEIEAALEMQAAIEEGHASPP